MARPESTGSSFFRITGGKGFQMTFDNGYTISVQFGPSNYIDNRSFSPGKPWIKMEVDGEEHHFSSLDLEYGHKGSVNAEIAVWGEGNDWVRLAPYDDVVGWLSADTVAQVITLVASAERGGLTSDDFEGIFSE